MFSLMENKDFEKTITKKEKKLRKEMKKWQIVNSGKSEILQISEKLF